MTGLTDLQKAVQDLTASVSAATTLISNLNAQVASLTAQLAAGGDNDATVETAAQAIEAQVTALNNAVTPPPAK